ncbi:MAG: diacylglycerol kinase family protein [Chthoniobacterales bacterium]
MNRGLLIYNAGAGGDDEASCEDLVRRLDALGVSVEAVEMEKGRDPSEVAREVLKSEPPFVLVAGGDGTVEAVATEFIGRKIPLGVIPCGTYNNFAKSLGIPDDVDGACEIIARRDAQPMDIGVANGLPFFECAGMGLDAEVFPLSEEVKEGGFSKLFALLRKAFRYPQQIFEIELDRDFLDALVPSTDRHAIKMARRIRGSSRQKLRVRALMLTVSNGPFYGMNFAVAPEAQVDDGMLTVSIFKRFSKLELGWHFRSISAGHRAYSPKSIQLRVKKIKISGPRPIERHLDGRSVEGWPVEFELESAALLVMK